MTPSEIRLRADLRRYRELAAALTERLLVLQDANEGAYRAAYDVVGGPHHCPNSAFGHPAVDPDAVHPDRLASYGLLLQRRETGEPA
ncbi:hypothetical protein [Streptomyces sp. H27-D2]|uniref:hypothetical protein n=1 Tax=Streptomyces sp. H27-D2 TaxID=3046304 RepID=UPI002DBAFE26|nr:hypothetical protein [Streptomyces sp. H27-D2]MEC4016016.1 hypothetical protein [Streptomyces sp. H27-D2]